MSTDHYDATKDTRAHPIPNSSQFAFPTIFAPLAESKDTTVASKGEWKFSNILEEHVVGSDFVHMLSFTARRRPTRGPVPDEGYEEATEGPTSAFVG